MSYLIARFKGVSRYITFLIKCAIRYIGSVIENDNDFKIFAWSQYDNVKTIIRTLCDRVEEFAFLIFILTFTK